MQPKFLLTALLAVGVTASLDAAASNVAAAVTPNIPKATHVASLVGSVAGNIETALSGYGTAATAGLDNFFSNLNSQFSDTNGWSSFVAEVGSIGVDNTASLIQYIATQKVVDQSVVAAVTKAYIDGMAGVTATGTAATATGTTGTNKSVSTGAAVANGVPKGAIMGAVGAVAGLFFL